jgi:hypothetical protein
LTEGGFREQELLHQPPNNKGRDLLTFTTDDGDYSQFFHEQDISFERSQQESTVNDANMDLINRKTIRAKTSLPLPPPMMIVLKSSNSKRVALSGASRSQL